MGNDKQLRNNLGQSTLEFIMTFTVAVGFIFLFLKMAMNYTDGYMVHHATYMSARAYLVTDDNRASVNEGDDRAFRKAQEVFRSYLPNNLVPTVNYANLKENSPDPGKTKFYAFVGIWIEYSQRFSLGFVGGKGSLRLISEAFLGREPTRSESRTQVCEAIKNLGLERCDTHVTLEDNGG